jgi:hypothetical protein
MSDARWRSVAGRLHGPQRKLVIPEGSFHPVSDCQMHRCRFDDLGSGLCDPENGSSRSSVYFPNSGSESRTEVSMLCRTFGMVPKHRHCLSQACDIGLLVTLKLHAGTCTKFSVDVRGSHSQIPAFKLAGDEQVTQRSAAVSDIVVQIAMFLRSPWM